MLFSISPTHGGHDVLGDGVRVACARVSEGALYATLKDTADLKEEKALLAELTTSGRRHVADGRFLADATIRLHGHERRLRVAMGQRSVRFERQLRLG